MIWLIPRRGGLGNQLFQHSAVCSVASDDDSILMLGMAELSRTFPGARGTFINVPRRIMGRLLMLRQTAPAHSFRHTVQSLSEDSMGLPILGTAPRARTMIVEGFFQNPALVTDRYVASLSSNASTSAGVDRFLAGAGLLNRPLIFVHLRFGDYRWWPSPEMPACLPMEWSLKQIEGLMASTHGAEIVILSDEQAAAVSLRSRLAYRAVIGPTDDRFALEVMARSSAGVLSASTFSWWGARIAQSRGATGPFIAPTYWAGHRKGDWSHPGLAESDLQFVPV